MDNPFLTAALAYGVRGWRVFPCQPKGKKPMLEGWPEKATTDDTIIRGWWERWPAANVAIATGPGSGFIALDIDVKGGAKGEESFAELTDAHGKLPATIEARTPTGGRHLFFSVPEGRHVGNKTNFRPGLDVRGDGGYILAAPSIHPDTGTAYELVTSTKGSRRPWEQEATTKTRVIARAPGWLLDIIAPNDRPQPAATPPLPMPRAPSSPQATPIVERARLYLQECEPAVQGQAGHEKLLWAARALVVGFELDEGTAVSLLWSDFNPRCVPPWDRTAPADIKDFERKAAEARRTPGSKPRGWLLDELGLRTDDEALMSMGRKLAASLLAGIARAPVTQEADPFSVEQTTTELPDILRPRGPIIDGSRFVPFPTHCFPSRIAEYVSLVAETHCVDESFVALPVLVVAGAAMGNAFRVRLKNGFEVPPTLWGAIVARSGANKTGPMEEVVDALREIPQLTTEEAMFNPQSRMLLGDVTVEVVIARLTESDRGLLEYRNELAGWVKGFDAYRKNGGADEQAWIAFWDAKHYTMDRKTGNEKCDIPAAAVSVLGGIQPAILAKCFDPAKFSSGLVPRLLVANPPEKAMQWVERELTPELRDFWRKAVVGLRTRPFVSMKTGNASLSPNIVELSEEAKSVYVAFFNRISSETQRLDEGAQLFASKTRVIAARIALILHGLATVTEIHGDWSRPVGGITMRNAVEMSQWFLNESLRVYGLSAGRFAARRDADILAWITSKGGRVTARDLMRAHSKRYTDAEQPKVELNRLADRGLGRWEGKEFVLS